MLRAAAADRRRGELLARAGDQRFLSRPCARAATCRGRSAPRGRRACYEAMSMPAAAARERHHVARSRLPPRSKRPSAALKWYCSAIIKPLSGRSGPRETMNASGPHSSACTQNGGSYANSEISAARPRRNPRTGSRTRPARRRNRRKRNRARRLRSGPHAQKAVEQLALPQRGQRPVQTGDDGDGGVALCPVMTPLSHADETADARASPSISPQNAEPMPTNDRPEAVTRNVVSAGSRPSSSFTALIIAPPNAPISARPGHRLDQDRRRARDQNRGDARKRDRAACSRCRETMPAM